ncbi:hypothetical protein [Frankia sp. AgB32]|uniref:hypothetical protein n=1 Tax=Frankia sp. AgB32 TaxID=631119 RepID=UPI00200EC313|nr:hypothetical protein [Frankia sp. AgB32]MCK9894141.1 hypothetical protein [Frankia sp. AgB32]
MGSRPRSTLLTRRITLACGYTGPDAAQVPELIVQRWLDLAAKSWRILTDQVAAARLGERSVAALYAATRREGARRVTYARGEGLTRDQAIRDLQGLKAAGLIEEIGHGRTQRYIAAGVAAEAERTIRAAHASQPLRDPYSSNPR